MNPALWSYMLSAVGVLGLFLAGKGKRLGWAVGFGAQGLWIAYATATHQFGFYISAAAYGSVYALNWWRWRKAQHAAPVEPMPTDPATCIHRCYSDLRDQVQRGDDGERPGRVS